MSEEIKKAPRKRKVAAKKVQPKVEDNTKEDFQKEYNYKHAEELLKVKHLKQYFSFKNGPTKYLKAVHDVSFNVYKGEVFGLVGESGCGKTTTGRDILKLYPITSGDIWLDGVRIAAGTRWNEKEIKFTNIRLRQSLKDLARKEDEALTQITSDYSKYFDERFSKRGLKTYFANPDNKQENRYRERKDYYDRYLAIEAQYHKDVEEVINNAKAICQEQRKQIKAAKIDDRNYNKNIATIAVKGVEEKYADFVKTYQEHKESNTVSEDEEKKYQEYKVELKKAGATNLANKVQMIFQDPIASLNPRMTVRDIISEGLKIQGVHDKKYMDEEVARVLKLVGLVPEHANRYPHEFSGGQRQRIGIARAVIMKPELIVADEPVSALDVSIQAQVINLLNDLRNSLGLTIIFIAHNLSVVKYFCDRIAVMYYGNLVELATSDELFAHPLHPYTESLLSAVPYPDPNIEANRQRIIYNPSQAHDYSKQKPTMRELVPGHFVLCNDEEETKYLEKLKQGKSIYAK